MNTHVKSDHHPGSWRVGAAEVDITPTAATFLFGYPHVERMSTGVHDPLLASALWIARGDEACLFISCDLIWVPRSITLPARRQLSQALDLPLEAIMITATHTHSGPVTAGMVSNADDPVVPPPDPAYLQRIEQAIVEAGQRACEAATETILQFATVDAAGLGGNRRDPAGPTIPTLPLLIARDPADTKPTAIMAVHAMHPTVLHEDSTLISGDFPGLARESLKQRLEAPDLVYLHHMGASGNQSPRRAVEANTIEEARRLGDRLAARIEKGLRNAWTAGDGTIRAACAEVDLPTRTLPPVAEAEAACHEARRRLAELRSRGADRADVRTAECDGFGAEETLTLARAANDDRLDAAARSLLPATVQVIELAGQRFVGWPGEVFVEFALDVMTPSPHTHLITLANSELQGYLVTQQAIDEKAYEAGNAIFASPVGGQRLVDATIELLGRLHDHPSVETEATP